jgi:hypothetical protein
MVMVDFSRVHESGVLLGPMMHAYGGLGKQRHGEKRPADVFSSAGRVPRKRATFITVRRMLPRKRAAIAY